MRRISAKDVAQPLRMELEQHRDTVVVHASGEIDVAHADRLRTRLLALIDDFRRVVLDLREVEFIDSTGLHCVLDVEAASQAAGVEFMLIRGPARVQRLFELTGTDDRFRFCDGVDGVS